MVLPKSLTGMKASACELFLRHLLRPPSPTTGATSSSLSVVTTRGLSAGVQIFVPTILAIDVNAKYYVIDVTGSGTVSVETILHAYPVALQVSYTPHPVDNTNSCGEWQYNCA